MIEIKLKEIGERIKTQDGRSTAYPLFVVYDWEKIPTIEDYSDDWEYADMYDGYSPIGKTKEKLIEHAKSFDMAYPDDEDIKEMDADELFEKLNDMNGADWMKNYYIRKRVFINAFFTEQSAKDFIERYNHHYSEPHIYVKSLCENPEMQEVRNALMEGRFIEKAGD